VVSTLFLLCTKVFLFLTFVYWVTNMFRNLYFLAPSRFKAFIFSMRGVKDIFNLSGAVNFLIISLLITIASQNLIGSIPGVVNSNLYYFLTCSISLIIWVSIIVVTFITQLRDFVAHILPYGTPTALILFLPLVEVFSNLIRPFTLMVRLRTNLSAGHIIMYMFSYFAIAGKAYISLGLSVSGLIFMLFCLEVFVCLLQAYIFTSLLALYYKESL